MSTESGTAVLFNTREEWLAAAVEALSPVWEKRTGRSIPQVRVGVGFTSSGLRGAATYQVWPRSASLDYLNEITIPLTLSDPVAVLASLGKALLFASWDTNVGTTKFNLVGVLAGYDEQGGVGLVLSGELSALAEALGEYPGDAGLAVAAEGKKQGTRMLKCECSACGFTFRTTRKHIEAATAGGQDMECPVRDCPGVMSVEEPTSKED